MADPQGLFFYGGIRPDMVRQAAYTLTTGITPSVATVTIVPQPEIPSAISDMLFEFGSVRLRFPQCKIDSATYLSGPPQLVTLRILDRRWRWQRGHISGLYNVRRPDGTLDEDFEKTPQELATLLLRAMGETRFNVGQLPNFARPEVEWIAATPAAELQRLCDDLGCRIVGGPEAEVRIVRAGVGNPLPQNDSVTSISYAVDPPNLPDSIVFLGGETRFESLWKMEAVGEDTDGDLEKINDLSYVPEDGWGFESPKGMYAVLDENSKTAQSLALKTVFRWYRITECVGDPFDKYLREADVDPPLKREHVLPLENGRASTRETEDDKEEQREPEITGVYWDEDVVEGFENTDAGTRFEGDFAVDTERGIVQFSEPVYKLQGTTETENGEATLKLLIAHPIKIEGKAHRAFVERRLSASPTGAGPLVIRRDDVRLVVKALYEDERFSGELETTEDLFTREANHYINAELAKFQTVRGFTIEYTGLMPLRLDGAIQQIAWRVGVGGAGTTASINSEFERAIPTYERRVEIELQREEARYQRWTRRALRKLGLA